MVSKLNKQSFMSEFKSHRVLHSTGLVPNLSRKLNELLITFK